MASDITLVPGTEPVHATTRLKNHRGEKTFYPVEGNHYAVVYLEAVPENVTSVKSLIDQAVALSVESQMVKGVADSNEDRRTSVNVQVTQLPNAQLE